MRGPGGAISISPARPRAEVGSPSPGALRSCRHGPAAGARPDGPPPGSTARPSADRVGTGNGSSCRTERARRTQSSPAGRGGRLIRGGRRCPGRAGQRLCLPRPRGKLPAPRQLGGPGGGPSRGTERCPLGRTARRSPRSRTSPAALLPLLTLLPRCAAAAPRRL